MDKTARILAGRLAVLLFFVMALTGWFCGSDPAVCTQRALIGAAILYLVVRIAGNLIVRILLEAMAQDRVRRLHKPRSKSDNL